MNQTTIQQFEHYERVAYPCGAYPQAHPERLAAMGILFGVQTVPIAGARILELGCGDGAHCIPIAYHFPQGKVVGIDLSPAHIERGQAFVEKLALHNCTLRVGDILSLSADDLGEFDYIIAHGVYSWVPESVREQLLALCRACLAPHGIAYISYNTQPGGHIRTMVREMMLFATNGTHDIAERVAQARAFLRFMAETTVQEQTGTAEYRATLQAELERVESMPDHVLFHDDLDAIARPFSFTEFMGRVQVHGLQYLGESDLVEMQEHFFRADTQERLAHYGGDDMIRREQLLDYVKYRRFRQTLICRNDTAVEHTIYLESLAKLFVTVSARTSTNQHGEPIAVNSYGVEFPLQSPLVRAVVMCMTEQYPHAMSAEEICNHIRPLLFAEQGLRAEHITTDDVCDVLVQLLVADMIEYHAVQLPIANIAYIEQNLQAYHPKASMYARLQAQSQTEVTTMRHTDIRLTDPLARLVLLAATGDNSIGVLEMMITRFLEITPIVLPAEYNELPLSIDKVLHVLRKLSVLGLLERSA